MIRRVRLFAGADGQSQVEERSVVMAPAGSTSALSRKTAATAIDFAETAAGARLDWHDDPHRRYVVTLAGRVVFETRLGQTFTIGPGDLLLAEGETGGGHRWRLLGEQPWRRVYVDIPRGG